MLKFRAPGVTLPIGLGTGRLVFRALNRVEAVLALAVIVAVAVGGPPVPVVVPAALAAVLLVVQLLVVRPRLTRRSDQVLAGSSAPRSRAHLGYVATESLKALTLLALGISALAA